MPSAPGRLERLLAERILVFDGAWGTMFQGHSLTEADYRGEAFRDHPRDLRGDHDVLVLTRPDVVEGIHRAYLDAGADIIETNTFNATRISQADYGLEDRVYELNVAAARIAAAVAREYSERDPGQAALRRRLHRARPTARCRSRRTSRIRRSARSRFDELKDAYAEQVARLVDGGVDLLLAETSFDTAQPEGGDLRHRGSVRREAARDFPVWLSGTIVDRSGRTLSGQTIEAFWVSIAHAKPLIVGLNCSLGAEEMRPFRRRARRHRAVLRELLSERRPAERVRRLRRDARAHLGAPARVRRARLGEHRRRLLRHDARAHRAIAGAVRGLAPRRPPAPDGFMRLSRARAAHRPPRDGLRDDRRAHQRDRLEALRAPGSRRRLRERARGRARAGARRRQHDRRQHGRGHARLRAGDDDVPESRRRRAGDRARADHGRQLEVVGDRGRASSACRARGSSTRSA